MTAPAYRRILLKLSGEALMGAGDHGIDPDVLERLAGDVRDLIASGVQVALVIGGGNIFRGAGLAKRGMDRVTGDQIGMLATVMNALAMQDTLERMSVPTRVMSASISMAKSARTTSAAAPCVIWRRGAW
jgi:uridylate kinase